MPDSTRTYLSTEFLGLMRHAQSWYEGMKREDRSPSSPALTVKGVEATTGVGRRLRELLTDTESAITILHVGTDQSSQTAAILYEVLGPERAELAQEPVYRLSPEPVHLQAKPGRRGLGWRGRKRSTPQAEPPYLAAYPAQDARDRVEDAWQDVRDSQLLQGSCVIVGHDPQMSWLLTLLVKRGGVSRLWQPPFPPLAAGELALVEPREGAGRHMGTMLRPRYVFSPTDSEAKEALVRKVESKMKTAGAIGAFLTALFTWGTGRIADLNSRTREGVCAPTADYSNVAYAGLLLLAMGVALYFVCLFLYDRLVMPSRFWGGVPPRAPRNGRPPLPSHLLRPPASDVRVLYEGMMMTWRRTFIPATFLGGAGVALLAVGLLFRCATLTNAELIIGVGVLAVLLVTVAAYLAGRSTLGIAD